jgi:hypothetical protein
MERKKLELPINQSLKLQLLFDEPLVGESKFGEYYMYAVKNGEQEYSFFAPLSVHEQLKSKQRGAAFTITKNVAQKGKKLVTDFQIKFLNNSEQSSPNPVQTDSELFNAMLQSYDEATRIQKQYNSCAINQCAITLFIAKSKSNGFNNFYKE